MSGLPTTGLLHAVAPRRFEDFVTNSFCWLLGNVPELGGRFLDFLCDHGRGLAFPSDTSSLTWDAQAVFWRQGQHPVRPDMTCTDGQRGVIFEHKTWAPLHHEQLANYRKFAPTQFKGAPVVLITAYVFRHGQDPSQDPDVALRWYDIHGFLGKFLEKEPDPVSTFLVEEFRTLLTERGLGPMHALRPDITERFLIARRWEKDLTAMLWEIARRQWRDAPDSRELVVKKNWDRLGFMVRGTWKDETWDPGLFVGVILDGAEHRIEPSNPDRGPDACVILDVRKNLHDRYRDFDDYRNLKALGALPAGWALWDIDRPDSRSVGRWKDRNQWHPIHIRRPLVDVLGDPDSAQDQADRFYDQTRKIVDLVLANLKAPWGRD